MKKISVIVLAVAILASAIAFTACKKDAYVDPSDGNEYILVTDEDGNKVLSDDGELLVYVTDENGKKVKDSDGNYETEVHGFVGQIENNGVVEDYAYYFTLPKGWETVNDRGDFENKSQQTTLNIEILEKTLKDSLIKLERIETLLKEDSAEGSVTDITTNEQDNLKVGSKIYTLGYKTNEEVTIAVIFSNNDNSYQFTYKTSRDISVADAEAEVIGIINASIKFKPYTYYPNVKDEVTTTK